MPARSLSTTTSVVICESTLMLWCRPPTGAPGSQNLSYVRRPACAPGSRVWDSTLLYPRGRLSLDLLRTHGYASGPSGPQATISRVIMLVPSHKEGGGTCGTCAHHRTNEYKAISSPYRGQFLDICCDGRAILDGGVGTGSVKWVPSDAWKNAQKFWFGKRPQKRNQYR